MKRYRSGFTMIELIFVIVVLGILAAIAIPRLAATRDDAELVKGRSDISAIRAGIVNERQARLLRGDATFTATLDSASLNTAGQTLFNQNNILTYGVVSGTGNGHWMKTGTTQYTYTVMNQPVTFNYVQASGTFDCDRSASGNAGLYCQQLTN